jgi:hypothetical protein
MLTGSLGWFALGAGSMALALGLANMALVAIRRRRNRKFYAMISELRATSAALRKEKKQFSHEYGPVHQKLLDMDVIGGVQ